MKALDINKFCFKIFHLPELLTTNSIRKENFHELNKYLSNHLKKLDSPTIHIGNKKQYFDFNETHHLLNPKSKFKWGELGIWASNLVAYKNLIKSGYEYALLIEDDILIVDKKKFLSLLLQYMKELPDDWEMFSFYCPENQFKKYNPEEQSKRKTIVPAYQDYSMVCYVVNRKCAIKVLDDIKQNGIDLPIDHYFFRNKNMFKIYALTPDAEKGCSLIKTDSTFQNIQTHLKVPLNRNEKSFKTWNENFTETQISQFKTNAIIEIKQGPENFWNAIATILNQQKVVPEKNLGKVLVYKSYGGLGDIFFAIPAINKLVAVSEKVDFAVSPRLVSFFKKHLDEVTVVDETVARTAESQYDNVYELGNYPAFRGYDLPHALTYPTHKKVKQHAIRHYIDTVAKLHKNLDNHLERYPYFKRTSNPKEKYYVVHHGAGFLLKIWPTDKYAALIERLHEIFPTLKCKIIQGPDDPDIESFFTKEMPHVEFITGGMEDVGEAMAGALFHIGNDAGITHVAGAFNVPSVGIYGPTGPGSWGSFAEHNELIWGKQGVCNIRCNYDVILNCDHRICLNSVTVDRVLEAIYKVLQRAYTNMSFQVMLNPVVDVEFGKKDCIIKLNGNDFLIEYHTPAVKKQLESLLRNPKNGEAENEDISLVKEVFAQQNILFKVPKFN